MTYIYNVAILYFHKTKDKHLLKLHSWHEYNELKDAEAIKQIGRTRSETLDWKPDEWGPVDDWKYTSVVFNTITVGG